MENNYGLHESLIEYLSVFIGGVSTAGFELRRNCVIKLEKLKDIVNGLDWISKALVETENLHGVNPINYNFSGILADLESGILQTDEIFLADILEYDILETIGDIYEKIKH